MKQIVLGILFLTVFCVPAMAQIVDSLGNTVITPELGFLERLSGRWNTSVRMWPLASDTTGQKAIGGSETHTTLEGRYLIQRDSTFILNRHYGDQAWLGFDYLKHKYVMVWATNRSSNLLFLTGTVNDSGNVLTMQGDREEAKGGKTKVKFVYRTFNGNYRVMEMWESHGLGKERRVMEILYTRGK